MTHRALLVLSLGLALATPLGASAQSAPPPAPEAPAAEAPAAEAPVEPAVAEPAVEAPAAPAVEPAAPSEAPADPVAPEAVQDPAPDQPAQDQPAPAEAPPVPVVNVEAQAAQKNLETSTLVTGPSASDKASQEARCAQLFAQGQTALAQAEGCSSGEAPVYAGSQIALSQLFAPAYRSLPDNDNGFYALNLYLAPRFGLTERWALFSDVTLGYEATQPDDTNRRNEVIASDTRVVVSGVLGTLGGITFTTGPRIIVPTSKPSWAARSFGLGTSLGAIKNFDVLEGLAVSLTGVYTHTFSARLNRMIREDDAPPCSYVSNGSESTSADCTASGVRIAQESFRIAPSVNLNVNDQWSGGLSYVYGWGLVKKFDYDTLNIGGSDVDVSNNVIDDTRWRRNGSLSLSVNYQPAPWLIATLSGNTSVCYDSPFGGQSSLGGCAGGSKNSDFWSRNPIANRFSTISLALTVPVDALIETIQKRENERKTAKAKGRAKL